jgi:cephalosporin hydroxylase
MKIQYSKTGAEHYSKTGVELNVTPKDVHVQNDLEDFFWNKNHNPISKWWHYFEVYERHLSNFRMKAPTILEIGVFNGGSMQMWKNYFGKGCKIYGIDIDPRCKKYEEEDIEIFIGSQEDTNFLSQVKTTIGQVDIIIDDGGHMMNQQIVSLIELFPILTNNGVYLCEDLHTSYWSDFGGGLEVNSSFINFSKTFIDKLNSWHCSDVEQDYFSKFMHSMHYYDSVLVIEKREMKKPWCFTK